MKTLRLGPTTGECRARGKLQGTGGTCFCSHSCHNILRLETVVKQKATQENLNCRECLAGCELCGTTQQFLRLTRRFCRRQVAVTYGRSVVASLTGMELSAYRNTVHSSLHLFIRSCINAFIHLCTDPYFQSFRLSFVPTFTRAFVSSFIPSFIYVIIYSFIHSMMNA